MERVHMLAGVQAAEVLPHTPPPVVVCTGCGATKVLAHEVFYDADGRAVRNIQPAPPPGWVARGAEARCSACVEGDAGAQQADQAEEEG